MNVAQGPYEQMIALLEDCGRMQRELLALSVEKRQVVTAGQTGRLSEITQLELKALAGLNALEKRRGGLAAAIAAETGADPQALTVGRLAELAPDPDLKRRLLQLQRELTALVGRLQELNRQNGELIKTHLDYGETMLNLMVEDAASPYNLYDEHGGAASGGGTIRPGLFDRET
ncbi:MAG: flagellar protein FlgN [Clostridiales bacterium]|nr:flagellar protein FlgN [Clostridiales bacterium]